MDGWVIPLRLLRLLEHLAVLIKMNYDELRQKDTITKIRKHTKKDLKGFQVNSYELI